MEDKKEKVKVKKIIFNKMGYHLRNYKGNLIEDILLEF